MSKPCSVCIRNDRIRIDAAIRDGTSLRVLARETGISKSSLHRHSQHMPSPPFALELTQDQMEMARLPFTPIGGRAWVRWRRGGATPEPRQEELYDPLRWQT